MTEYSGLAIDPIVTTTTNYHSTPLPPVPGTRPAPQTPSSPPRTPLAAVVSLIFGLMAFLTMLVFIGAFPAIIAVIAGHVAISRIRHSQGRLAGHAIAVTGVVLGYMTLVGTSILMLVVLFAYQPARQALTDYRQHQSMRNASHLYFAAEAYARDHNGKYPKKWSDLKGRYINSLDLARRLSSVHSFRKSTDQAFQLVPHQRPVLPAISAQVVVIQETAPPDIEMITVLYSDGNTELIANPNRDSEP